MRALLRGLGGLAWLAATLVGLPMLLLWIPQGSLAQLLPHRSEMLGLITGNPLDPGLILIALTAVGWICWLQLLVSFIIEVVYEVRGLQVPNLGRWMPQTSVARAVSAVAMLAATFVPTTPSHAAPPPAAAVSQSAPHAATTAGPNHHAQESKYQVYEVVEGDCLWDIADRELHDPERWPEIYHASTHREQADGQHLRDPDLLLPGWQLNIPKMATRKPATKPTGEHRSHKDRQANGKPAPDPVTAGSLIAPATVELPATPLHRPAHDGLPAGTPLITSDATGGGAQATPLRPPAQQPDLPDWLIAGRRK